MRTSTPNKKTDQARGGTKGSPRSSRTASTDAGRQDARAGHTPGPWTAQLNDAPLWVQSADGAAPVICDLVPRDADVFTEEDEANAELIAAAPDLYAACAEFVRKVECGEARSTRSYGQMKAALAKAEGKG